MAKGFIGGYQLGAQAQVRAQQVSVTKLLAQGKVDIFFGEHSHGQRGIAKLGLVYLLTLDDALGVCRCEAASGNQNVANGAGSACGSRCVHASAPGVACLSMPAAELTAPSTGSSSASARS